MVVLALAHRAHRFFDCLAPHLEQMRCMGIGVERKEGQPWGVEEPGPAFEAWDMQLCAKRKQQSLLYHVVVLLEIVPFASLWQCAHLIPHTRRLVECPC